MRFMLFGNTDPENPLCDQCAKSIARRNMFRKHEKLLHADTEEGSRSAVSTSTKI